MPRDTEGMEITEPAARTAYIQADEGGQPYSPNGAAAARGFSFLGYDVRLFRPAELPDLPLTPETIVVGGVPTIHTALERIGVRRPSHVTVPAILQPFLGRECWRTTVAGVRGANRFPVFVKPYIDSKVFTGRVVRDAADLERLLEPRDGFPTITDDFPLLAQEPVNFQSEWRTFVVQGRIVGMSHYKGDPLLFPAPGVIRATLGAYQSQAPAGYSADFGVTDEGRTLLVEINDGYALGNGALVTNLYAELLKARWEEITG
jgi:hypothetical protein